MARGNMKPIRAVNCIPLKPEGGNPLNFNDMTDEQRKYWGTALKMRFLNSVYAGKYEFYSDDTGDDPQSNGRR